MGRHDRFRERMSALGWRLLIAVLVSLAIRIAVAGLTPDTAPPPSGKPSPVVRHEVSGNWMPDSHRPR